MPENSDTKPQGFFEGTWETHWTNLLNLASHGAYAPGVGYDTFLRFGDPMVDPNRNGHVTFIGRGHNGNHGRAQWSKPPLSVAGNNSWTVVFKASSDQRLLVGRWHSGPWTPSGEREAFPPNQEFMPLQHPSANSLQWSGQVFFELTADGTQFTGGWNSSTDPNWRPWDGRKISDDPRLQRDLTLPDWDDVTGWPRDIARVTSITAPTELL
jgi:hypothetical protein